MTARRVPRASPSFQADRLSYMLPSFTMSSPSNRATYTSNTIPLSFSAMVDLGNAAYSIRTNADNTWIVRNASLVQSIYRNSLAAPTVVNGPSSLNLKNGNYTLRILAGSTGWGYKALVHQKRINYTSQGITFVVSASMTSTTTSTTAQVPELSLPLVVPTMAAVLLVVSVLVRIRRSSWSPSTH